MSLKKVSIFRRPLATYAFVCGTPFTVQRHVDTWEPKNLPTKSYKIERNFTSIPELRVYHTDMGGSKHKNLNVSYQDVLEAQKDNSVLIIDVRSQEEINETGKLPGSIHIPMKDVPDTLSSLPEDQFKQRYGKDKPTKDTKIILSCRAGTRSAMVQEAVQKLGYENAYNYSGGWLDWESNHKA